jgi:hypothetical protein
VLFAAGEIHQREGIFFVGDRLGGRF